MLFCTPKEMLSCTLSGNFCWMFAHNTRNLQSYGMHARSSHAAVMLENALSFLHLIHHHFIISPNHLLPQIVRKCVVLSFRELCFVVSGERFRSGRAVTNQCTLTRGMRWRIGCHRALPELSHQERLPKTVMYIRGSMQLGRSCVLNSFRWKGTAELYCFSMVFFFSISR